MATCYRCGRPIASTDFKLRRRVKTGERISRRYPNPSISSLHINYGIRLVCASCARAIDFEAARREMVKYVELGIALIFLAVALYLRYFG
jgi:DNA-directed RNA polymerase subunit N (RpoN/RPB10)